jgi:hypothetical protein
MADYKLLDSGGVYHVASGRHIPPDPANRHWQEYQRWLAAGNTPELAPSAVRGPQPFQVARPAGVAREYYQRERVYG